MLRGNVCPDRLVVLQFPTKDQCDRAILGLNDGTPLDALGDDAIVVLKEHVHRFRRGDLIPREYNLLAWATRDIPNFVLQL